MFNKELGHLRWV